MTNNKRLPKRLSTRCKLPEIWDLMPEEERLWPPLRFYEKNPMYKMGELIFDPKGDNAELLNELLTRAKAHQTNDPFYITDVLFADEMERVFEDWKPARRKRDELLRSPLEKQEWAEYESDHNRKLERMETHYIERVLDAELLSHVRAASGHPAELAEVIESIMQLAAKEQRRQAATVKNLAHRQNQQMARELAENLWRESPSLSKNQVATRIKNELDLPEQITTIMNWIKPVVPVDRKVGGRPKKSSEK